MNKKVFSKFIVLYTVLFSLFALLTPETGYGQNARVTIKMEHVPLKQIMDAIEEQTSYLFVYQKSLDLTQTCRSSL